MTAREYLASREWSEVEPGLWSSSEAGGRVSFESALIFASLDDERLSEADRFEVAASGAKAIFTFKAKHVQAGPHDALSVATALLEDPATFERALGRYRYALEWTEPPSRPGGVRRVEAAS